MDYKNTIFDIDCVMPLEALVQRGLTEEEKSIWLVGHNKVRLTTGLFIDHNTTSLNDDNFSSVYTLQDCKPIHYKNYNGMVRYDLKQLYLACGDITEVEFISKFMYDVAHWEKLCSNKVYNKIITKWRELQRLKVKSQMFGVILEDAHDPLSRTKTSSAKYLLDKYYDPTTPNNKQNKKDKDEDKRKIMDISEDKERILSSLRLVK